MTDNRLSLFCLVDGEAASNAFPVNIMPSKTIGDLKDLIKTKKAPRFDDVAADELTLWRVSIPDDDDEDLPISLGSVPEKKKLKATSKLSKVFDTELPEDTIHVLVQRPLPGDLRVDIKKITDKFFAPGTPITDFLDAYVRGERHVPVTTTAGDPVPERFQSNVLLSVLEGMQAQDLPVFGVSGCGKTRSMIEMLCLQWGFYFNASKNDLGSDDLSLLARSIDDKVLQEQSISSNTVFAKNRTLLLFLSRLLIFNYCLEYPGCRQTFSSARWALLQVCPNMFRDVFSELFSALDIKLKAHVLKESDLLPLVREVFESIQQKLLAFNYPNFSTNTKLRLVVDEAQILSDRGSTSFVSSSSQGDLRPMLSPILNGFRSLGGRGELTIIYCGTGLSIRTLHWALSSGDGVKEYGSSIFPYIEFPGWTGPDSVQSHIDRMKECLPDDDSKTMVDALIPPAAVDMLHKRLTGRFRPIVTAIEGIIKTGKPNDWETAINNTEIMITSWKDRDRRGNLCGELNRLEAKIANHPELFTSSSSLRETLGLFLYRYCLLDATEIVLENEVQLVEAAFGRIKIFGGTARTVLDEPFVLKATFNYFREKDPSLVSAAERAMLHSDNASVHGNMWESCMPPVFIETFKTQPLSSWPLLTNSSLPDQLTGDVTIVGYDDQQPKLAVSHRSLTTQQFMKAHVENGSKQGDQDIPPFYFPAPHVSGPDIVFYIKINNKIYPVFVQLKLRQVLEGSDVEKALATVSSHAMQEKMDKEQEKMQKEQKQQIQQQPDSIASVQSDQQQPPRLQDYCPTGTYISMVITYPAEVVKFQVVRPDPEPELEGLQRVSIDIDDNNFPKIFPRRHVEFLDKLKGHKRRSEADQSETSKKKRVIDPRKATSKNPQIDETK
ncbi:hypothetical protein CPB97_010991 [Podila verticillata]|nr:hypothetical protein CPB97_010991 [Podila verticillata]